MVETNVIRRRVHKLVSSYTRPWSIWEDDSRHFRSSEFSPAMWNRTGVMIKKDDGMNASIVITDRKEMH